MQRQTLPVVGGPVTWSYHDVPDIAHRLVVTYGEMSELSLQAAAYNRARFVVMEGAWLDCIIEDGYEPSHDDRRWILTNVAECLAVALAGGTTSAANVIERAAERMRIAVDVLCGTATIGGRSGEPWFGFPPFVAVFDHTYPIDGFADEAIPSTPPPSWREFFDEIMSTVPNVDVLDDQWQRVEDADRCWRCDAVYATSDVGLCDECLTDLKAGDA